MSVLDRIGGLVCRVVGHRWHTPPVQPIPGGFLEFWPRCTRCGALRDGAR